MSRLAAQYRVFFVEEPVPTPGEERPRLAHRQEDALYGSHVTVVHLVQPAEEPCWMGHGDPRTQRTYEKLLGSFLTRQNVGDPVMWLYTPMALELAQACGGRLLVYDVMDELSAFKGAPAQLKNQERQALKQADVVFTGGPSLYQDKRTANANTHLFPSGVDAAHFGQASAARCPRPADLPSAAGPVLGYFGVIDERMDLHLLAEMAAAHPEWQIVLIGPVVKIDHAALPQAPNLHYLGRRDYQELPAYLAHFDVALVPFALSEATRYLSPTKTLEYMAAHKPIVSTPIPDLVYLYGEVARIGDTPQAFIHAVEKALAETDIERAARHRREAELLNEYSWDRIAGKMHKLMQTTGAANVAKISAKA